MIVVHFLDISSCLSQKISKTCFIINEFKRKKNKIPTHNLEFTQEHCFLLITYPCYYIHLYSWSEHFFIFT